MNRPATPTQSRRRQNNRRRNERRGRRAEWLACLWLMLCGWQILARRRQLPAIEIDILARRGAVLAIVEVKYRRTMADAVRAVTPAAAARLARAAHQLAIEQRAPSARVDLIAMAPWRLPRHMVNIARHD